jgi:tetratricopeptide (TPR) repeat protein
MYKISFLICIFLFGVSASAATLYELQAGWESANYISLGDEQVKQFESLIVKAESAVSADPDNAELLIWRGIILSTYAGKASGLSALRLIKQARSSLESAMDIDDMALNGSAYTSLGALYYQVPGWPIAFGNNKKARQYLMKALSVNPDGIDSNYFYGDFLIQEQEYQEATRVLQKALAAESRPGREVADEGRRQEINALLENMSK